MSLLCMHVQVPKASNPTQVEAKEVQLSDIAPIMLDDTDLKTVSFIYSDWELSSCYFTKVKSVVRKFTEEHIEFTIN
jgi:hypothetical protein